MLLSSTDIIKRSIFLYKVHYRVFIRYMLLLFIPTALAVMISILGAMAELQGLAARILSIVLFVIVYSSSLWISIAFIRATAKAYTTQTTGPINASLKEASALFLPTLWVSILTGLIVLGGLFLLFIPGIVFIIWYVFAFYHVSIDGTKGMAALKESKMLVAGRFFPVLGRLVAPTVVFILFALIADGILSLILSFVLPETATPTIALALSGMIALLSTLLSLLLTPLSTSAITILYEELKQTKA